MSQQPSGFNEPKDSSNGHSPAPGTGTAKEIWEWTKSILLALGIVLILHTFVFHLSTVKGQSMEPTLVEGEWLFVNKFIYVVGSPKRGEVVILRDPEAADSERQFLVKRVVAVPGDRVEIRDRLLHVNGEPVTEPYTNVTIEDGDMPEFVIEPGYYFVMGDNRHQNKSKDSRSFGPVQAKLIEGRADMILWPISKAGGL